ncbi:MAG TPA: hypothetical protein VJU18_09415 [Vicinamibacteria bacterium]|nr:hypothetical protein [Vicinamibacteria bacterium]
MRTWSALVGLSLAATLARAQMVPLTGEFQVHTYTTNDQVYPSIAAAASGAFVVVWESRVQDPDGSRGIVASRFDPSGQPIGGEIAVNAYFTGGQIRTEVTATPSGGFVVVWDSFLQDGSSYGVFGRAFNESGTPLGPEFQVNAFTTGPQYGADVAVAGDGHFVVVWGSRGQDGDSAGVLGRLFDPSGTPLGPEFLVNTYTTSTQASPAVAMNADGAFVVTWNSLDQDGSERGVFAQRFAPDATPVGPELAVNTFTTSFQRSSAVAVDGAGGFVVAWHSYGQDGDNRGIFARRYNPSGIPLGPEFQVNTFTPGPQYGPSVAMDTGGGFVVTWDSFGPDGSSYAIAARRFDASAAALSDEFIVNAYTPASQFGPVVAPQPGGAFVIAWNSPADASAYGVFARRFGDDILFRDGFED